jgi:DNA-binding NtrC family response regulator
MPEKASLLIIDDNENMLETLGDILQEKGYRTETAKTGEEAIKKAKEDFFNVALIDIKLPDMTGIEVLKTFREKYPSRLNIIITAHADLQNAVNALNLGANAYIKKPIDHETLDQMIKECLQKQEEALTISQEKLAEFVEEEIEKKTEEEARTRLMKQYYRKLP